MFGMTSGTVAPTDISDLPGLRSVWAESLGDPRIIVAVLDGPVDQSHPSLAGAQLTRLPTLVTDAAKDGRMSIHGTHIASVIFGQPESSVRGIAPGCQGLIIPVFSDNQKGSLSQLDLARAINQAVEQGAHVINISGGQLSASGEAEQLLAKAVQFCNDNNVLIVAAAGNDACRCLHVPAALPSVLAVGATNAGGLPLDLSNWGDVYQMQGILAPGENILGAMPGGGTIGLSGTSFATPIVSGVVALLLSIQLQRGEAPDPHAVREAILSSALACDAALSDRQRCLVGKLNIPGAHALIRKGEPATVSDQPLAEAMMQPSAADFSGTERSFSPVEASLVDATDAATLPAAVQPASVATLEPAPLPVSSSENSTSKPMINSPSGSVSSVSSVSSTRSVVPSSSSAGVVASEGCGCNGGGPKQLVYALGTLNYDFGTEAHRDSFRQVMPEVNGFPANPYDAAQMVSHLTELPEEAPELIWTLNIELTPVYAIEPAGAFARSVYERLISTLAGQIRADNDPLLIERVSIPGYLSGKTVMLFSGQVVPVVVPQLRGIFSWNVNSLIDVAIRAIGLDPQAAPASTDGQRVARLRTDLREFLNRLYFDLRNLGQTSQERALNYAATNAFQSADTFREAGDRGLQLDLINVERSPFCRMDSDCWDVRLTFFDPENNQRARRVFRYTIDVSDLMPVTIGDVRSWSIS
jgi:cyanobactin maturation PatA/PatG family protease